MASIVVDNLSSTVTEEELREEFGYVFLREE